MAEEPEVPPLLEQVLELHEARERKLHPQPLAAAAEPPAPAAVQEPAHTDPAETPTAVDDGVFDPPTDFDPHAAIVALFGDPKGRLVPLGYAPHELDELDELDPALDIVALADEPEPDFYEFTPATNLN